MKKIVIIVVPLLILVGAGAFVGLKYFAGSPEDVSKKEEKKEVVITQFPLETFIVNLSGDEGRRYLKAKLVLDIDQEKQTDIDKNLHKVRDALILVLSNKTYSDIYDREGKSALREELKSALENIVGKKVVIEVYLTEFVVQ